MRAVGIDLGGTNIKAGAVDAQGRILERRSIPTGLADGAQAVIARMAGLARELGIEGPLGVGSPGLIDAAGGRILECPNLHDLQEVPLRDELARHLGIASSRVVLENDANVAALGEHWLGAGRGVDDVLVVTLGTGVGGGLVLGGKLYSGPGGMAGEIGHIVVDPSGPRCGCGRLGCLETLASPPQRRSVRMQRACRACLRAIWNSWPMPRAQAQALSASCCTRLAWILDAALLPQCRYWICAPSCWVVASALQPMHSSLVCAKACKNAATDAVWRRCVWYPRASARMLAGSVPRVWQ